MGSGGAERHDTVWPSQVSLAMRWLIGTELTRGQKGRGDFKLEFQGKRGEGETNQIVRMDAIQGARLRG